MMTHDIRVTEIDNVNVCQQFGETETDKFRPPNALNTKIAF